MSGHVVIIYNRAGTSCRVRGSVLAGTDDGYGDNGVCDQVWDKRNFVDIRRGVSPSVSFDSGSGYAAGVVHGKLLLVSQIREGDNTLFQD